MVALLLVTAVLAVVVMALSPLVGSVTVGDRAAQEDVAFGAPFPWVRQDQSDLEPPLPATLRLASPWEHPTGMSLTTFAVDVAAVFAVVAAAGALVVAARGRRTRSDRVS